MPEPNLVDQEGLGGRFSMQDGCLFGDDVEIDLSGDVTLGEGVAFGNDVLVLTHYHPDYIEDGAPHDAVAAPLVIEHRAFIGDRAIILPQVRRIGINAIVGAGSVVTKDVPDNCVVAGNPARIVRVRSWS